jgi:hypothetical protein
MAYCGQAGAVPISNAMHYASKNEEHPGYEVAASSLTIANSFCARNNIRGPLSLTLSLHVNTDNILNHLKT